MVDLTLAFDLVFVLAAAFIGGAVATVFRQPVITGYLIGGLVFGPQALGLIHETADIKTLAEVGVAFLMFTVGLEFSFSRIRVYSRVVVMGVVVQILVSTVSALLFSVFFGWTASSALFFGLMLGFSSTAVVVKSLLGKGELETTYGKLASSWLILQDIAVLPALIILSSIGGQNVVIDLGEGILKTVLFLAVTVYLGTKFAPKILGQIAASGSREIFLLAAMILVLGVAFLTRQFGLSFALGGFLAGLIISESQFSQQVFADVKNVRDLFATLFFVSIGMLVGPIFILQNIIPILLVIVLMIAGKLIITSAWIFRFGYHMKTAVVLANLGVQKGFINDNQYQLILASALVSLILTPFWIDRSGSIYHFLKDVVISRVPAWQHLFFTSKTSEEGSGSVMLQNHIIVVGYGRVGRFVSHALLAAKIPHVVSDLDPKRLAEPQSKGVPTVYGDAAEEEILALMNVRAAKALVITHGEIISTVLAIHRARKLAPNIKILARAHSDADVANLRGLAIYRVIQPEFESSLTMSHKVLDFMNVPKPEIEDLMRRLRREHHG
jgi:CPA2 family monovalent cation:H+ antiporter-2